MKNILLFFTLFITSYLFSQEALITGYVDSPCPGANGRVLEIYINGTIDLTNWKVQRQSNGNGFTTDIDLTSFSSISDAFLYVTNDETILASEFGISSNVLMNGNINSNGNDAFQIVNAANTVIDRFGEDNVDGAGTAWEHTDSFYLRNDMETANGGSFNAANWTFGAIDSLDGEGLCNGSTTLSTQVTLGSFIPSGLSFTLEITEIFSGQAGDDLTADWFEITNNGSAAWVSGSDGDLYYDDESTSSTDADIINGITDIQPGETIIVLITDDVNEVTTFTGVWSPVIDLSGIEIGTTDGAGLGGGGDAVTLWVGDPTATTPVDSATYPDTAANDGQSYDSDLGAFSVVGNANGAVETIALGGDAANVPNIGSPGNGPAITSMFNLLITEIFSGQAGDDLTADWFEITNTGVDAWISGVDGDLYYDDESASSTDADIINGITDIQPGETIIVLITDDVNEVTTFTGVWNPVIDLSGIKIGTTDGAGLGGGGDTVTLWVGDPTATTPVDSATYPDTAANDGQSYDSDLGAFSVVGNANGAVETIAQGGSSGNVPNIGSPGSAINMPVTVTVEFDTAFTSVSESGAGIEIFISPSQAPTTQGSIDVSLITAGTAVEGTDFIFASTQTITFPAGSTDSQSVLIPILNNTEDNADVFFVLQLENESDVQIGAQDVFSVYILDDDTVIPAGDSSVLDMNFLASYLVDASGTAEITAYDPITQRLFVTNSESIEVLDFSDPENISSLASVALPAGTSGVQSVAVNNGIVAAAVSAETKTDNGFVLFADTDGNNQVGVEVGALPDMLTFTPDGSKVIVANEGEPNSDYTIDPEGSVSIIDVSGGLGAISQANVTTLNFNAFNPAQAALEAAGVRIFGPGATVSQDLEPEYITVSNDNLFAYVVLQENNAYAVVDLTLNTITQILPFGLKDHSLPENSLDVSNDTDFIFDSTWPVYGMYMPDAISFYEIGGVGYIVTANEGDAREYDTFEEERNIGDSDYILDASVFNNVDILALSANLGEINVTNASGDIDNDGEFEEIHVFGGRSFSIFEANTGTLVYDSGNDFETITANHPIYGAIFNASNSNNSFKDRSDNKGPEPEGVIVKEIDGNHYAFILLERIGGVMVYDVSDPMAPVFVQYLNSRGAVAGDPVSGDLGPEGVVFVDAVDSPTGSALLIVSNEVSATLSIFSLDNVVLGIDEVEFTNTTNFVIYPNPANERIYLSKPGNYSIYDITGRIVKNISEASSIVISDLSTGTYIVSNTEGVSQKLIIK
ncbi:choice-of-anchor I family protein [Patiriisocius hiemis]|uniref:Choice-of-anchor I family protein n=1 Tax=Patiriisocius hiemis TaxID=3075604 RepID=A0ABU2Y8U7_9FLAO|nr:choice-of-anchor I family protein [Constantimarinum sp. W242]MDT0554601.1 choice-of-anchor I family protein [Constantimarinum sp. W242]